MGGASNDDRDDRHDRPACPIGSAFLIGIVSLFARGDLIGVLGFFARQKT